MVPDSLGLFVSAMRRSTVLQDVLSRLGVIQFAPALLPARVLQPDLYQSGIISVLVLLRGRQSGVCLPHLLWSQGLCICFLANEFVYSAKMLLHWQLLSGHHVFTVGTR